MQLCSKLLSWQPYGSRPLVSTPFFFAPKSNDSKQNLEKLCDSENWENPFLSIAIHEIDILWVKSNKNLEYTNKNQLQKKLK